MLYWAYCVVTVSYTHLDVYKRQAKESVDLTKGLTEGTEYNKDSAYATVSTLETAGVNVLSELSTPEQPVTIDGVKYTQFIQASTAADVYKRQR